MVSREAMRNFGWAGEAEERLAELRLGGEGDRLMHSSNPIIREPRSLELSRRSRSSKGRRSRFQNLANFPGQRLQGEWFLQKAFRNINGPLPQGGRFRISGNKQDFH